MGVMGDYYFWERIICGNWDGLVGWLDSFCVDMMGTFSCCLFVGIFISPVVKIWDISRASK